MTDVLKIDTHLHLYETKAVGAFEKGDYGIWEYGEKPGVKFSEYDGDLEDTLEAMDAAGVHKALVVNLFSTRGVMERTVAEMTGRLSASEREAAIRKVEAGYANDLREFNVGACERVKGHDNLFPYIALDAIAMPGEEGAAHLREMVEEYGARGVKLHGPAQGFNMSDERMWPAYRACQEMGMPIVAHSGPDKLGMGYAEPRAFAGMLAAFPDLKVVIAHMGGGTWGQTRELADAYANAYFDCCEIIEWVGGATNAPGEEEFAQLIRDIGPSRVFMGSDFPWYDLDRTIEQVMGLPLLSNEEKEGMLGAYAERALGL